MKYTVIHCRTNSHTINEFRKKRDAMKNYKAIPMTDNTEYKAVARITKDDSIVIASTGNNPFAPDINVATKDGEEGKEKER